MAGLKYDLDINSSYTFSLLVPAVLGQGYANALLAGILDYSSAISLVDVTALHAAALPNLPAGTPSDPKKLIYYKLISATGAVVVIAQDWIATTPTLIQATVATVTISNISTGDLVRLADVLHSNGFNSFVIN